MKNILKSLFAAGALMLGACDIEDPVAVLNTDISTSISASSSSITLVKETPDDPALTLSWTAPDFGFNAAPNYGIKFSTPEGSTETVASTRATEKSYSMKALNTLLLGLGYEPGVQAAINVTLTAALGDQPASQIAATTINVTPYATVLNLTTDWGVVGNATPGGWNGPDIPFYSVQGNPNALVAYATLVDGEMKFRTNNAWDVNLGDNGADGTLEQDGANIPVTAGNYRITLTLNGGSPVSFSIEPFSWGVIGDATPGGWGSDFDMEYDPSTDTFKAIGILGDGFIKFRKNDDWAENLGDSGADGVLDPGGDNIPVTAGNYIITLDLRENTYSLEEVVVWGIIGTATADGWNSDQDMRYDFDNINENVWYLSNYTLAGGEFKFRADNDWALNYGDDGNDGSLEAGGANIPINAGNYDIVLDLSDSENPTYTITAR